MTIMKLHRVSIDGFIKSPRNLFRGSFYLINARKKEAQGASSLGFGGRSAFNSQLVHSGARTRWGGFLVFLDLADDSIGCEQ